MNTYTLLHGDVVPEGHTGSPRATLARVFQPES